MLLGYDKDGEIQFIFTNERYLDKIFPNNSAKISNFWKIENHGLKELFVPISAIQNWDDYKRYRVIDGALVLKNDEEIKELKKNEKPKIIKQGLFVKQPYAASEIRSTEEVIRK